MLLLACCSNSLVGQDVPFSIQGPGVDPGLFRITTFASGLNFPIGMAELDDGSILTSLSLGNSFFNSNAGALVRLADDDGDGVADSQTVLYNRVPGGSLSTVRKQGDLIFTTGQNRTISVFRTGAAPTDTLTLLGTIDIGYPNGGWAHPHSALAVRETPGAVSDVDLIFQVGSRVNFASTSSTATLLSTSFGLDTTLNGDAIHKVTFHAVGDTYQATQVEQLATGLRNAAGFVFDEIGNLYLQDNGIDGLVNANEPTSADELNFLAADQIGGEVEDFGFPTAYVEYRTGQQIGTNGIHPLVAFQPLPDSATGDEAEGPNDIALAPPLFPEGLNHGMFVGMHGRFGNGGLANEENPLVFVNLDDNSYFHFIGVNETAVGHLDGLLSTRDSLYIADLAPIGSFAGSAANSGRIYRIQAIPEPDGLLLLTIGWMAGGFLRRKRTCGIESVCSSHHRMRRN